MKPNSGGVNKESFGHQSIATAWAKDDGKPKKISENATKKEVEEWAMNMTAWALKGAKKSVDLPILNEKKTNLQKKRIETSIEYARIRRLVQTEKDAILQCKKAIDTHLVTLNSCKSHMYKLIETGERVLANRHKLDKMREEIVRQITILEAENDK